MSLSKRHLEDVCLLNSNDKSAVCRYLLNDELDSSKWHCQKLKIAAKRMIDRDVVGGLGLIPSGDNCPGYPILKNIMQGYDLDG